MRIYARSGSDGPPVRPSRPLAMNPGPQLPEDAFRPGERLLVRAADREDHALSALDLVGRCDAQPIVGDAHPGQDLDGEVPLGRVVEEGDDAEPGLGRVDGSGPDLGHFHGKLLFGSGGSTSWSG